jgi:hypothetical protein
MGPVAVVAPMRPGQEREPEEAPADGVRPLPGTGSHRSSLAFQGLVQALRPPPLRPVLLDPHRCLAAWLLGEARYHRWRSLSVSEHPLLVTVDIGVLLLILAGPLFWLVVMGAIPAFDGWVNLIFIRIATDLWFSAKRVLFGQAQLMLRCLITLESILTVGACAWANFALTALFDWDTRVCVAALSGLVATIADISSDATELVRKEYYGTQLVIGLRLYFIAFQLAVVASAHAGQLILPSPRKAAAFGAFDTSYMDAFASRSLLVASLYLKQTFRVWRSPESCLALKVSGCQPVSARRDADPQSIVWPHYHWARFRRHPLRHR